MEDQPIAPDGYRLEHTLGHGSMGVVYAARHIRTGQPAAIKWLMNTSPQAYGSALQRFEREASLASNIDSPHVVRTLDLGRVGDGLPYMVMERFEGQDLQALLNRTGPLAPETALRIAAQTCLGLSAAHKEGIIHRDIKPSNLLLARLGNGSILLKILDFGIAKISRDHPDAIGGAHGLHTTEGRVMGSPFFLSPEQLYGKSDIDQQADIFALGITLYTMLVGTVPFPDVKNFVRFLLQATSTPPRPVHEAAPWVRPQISQIVQNATRLDRAERYPTAQVMYDAILEVLQGHVHLHEEMLVAVNAETPMAATS